MIITLKQLLHWLVARWYRWIALLLLLLWIAVLVAYRLGAQGFSVSSRSGQTVNLDFGREHDRQWVRVGPGEGMELNVYGAALHGSVAKLKPGLPVLCWVCGDNVAADPLVSATHRQGDWYFKAPEDFSKNSEATHGLRQVSRDYILTLAYNVATRERVIVAATSTPQAQQAELAARGLSASVANLLKVDATWRGLSMQREGCVVFNVAFIALALLLVMIAVPVELLRSRFRRRREQQRIALAIVRKQ